MPKLWNETIQDHRREVREAIIQTAVSLVEKQGLFAVTMSQIAEATGIGRATLYKHFPDVETILHEWHERQIERHLRHLAEVRDAGGDALERLEAVLEAYAYISHESRGHRDTEFAALLHRNQHVVIAAERRLRDMISDCFAVAAREEVVRTDVPPHELASYCLHALAAARALRGKPAVQRLLKVTLSGVRSIPNG